MEELLDLAVIMGGGSQYLSRKSYYKAFAFTEQVEANQVEYLNYGLDVVFNYTFYSLANTMFLNFGVGATIGYDQITNTEVLDLGEEFNTGGIINVEGELFLTNKVAAILQANQRTFLKGKYGDRRWFAGIGLKYSF